MSKINLMKFFYDNDEFCEIMNKNIYNINIKIIKDYRIHIYKLFKL